MIVTSARKGLSMDERTAIIELVDAIFDTVDAKDWDAARALFEDDDLVGGWQSGLHAQKQSWHLVSHYKVDLSGDSAVARVKGYAWNRLSDELGGAMWEVWGSYEIPVRRDGAGWKATGFVFNAVTTRGDDAVPAHTL